MVWAIWWNQETLTGNFPQGSVLVSLPRPPQWELWDSPCEERMGLPWEDSRQPQNRAGTAHSWAVITCLTQHKPTVCQLCKRSEKMSHSHRISRSEKEEEDEDDFGALEQRFLHGEYPWRDFCEAGISWRTVAHGWTHTGVGKKCETEVAANKSFKDCPIPCLSAPLRMGKCQRIRNRDVKLGGRKVLL